MRAEIIIVGEEILSGQTIDSNSAYIARKLANVGIEVVHKTTVGDRHDDMTEAIKTAWNRSAVTIMTGGLGPTTDDLTKNAICAAFDRKLVLQDEVLKKLEELHRSRNIKMPAMAQSQALQPQGADLLNNPVGTAPGIVFQDSERFFAALPGVPAEMEALIDQSIIPYLSKRPGRNHIVMRRIRTIGVTETGIAELITDLEPRTDKVRLAYLPSYKGVDLRVTSISPNETEAIEAADSLAKAITSRIGDYVFTTGDESMPEIVGALLRAKGKTVATAESCTGGLIAKMLTDMAGSSDYFRGSVVSYANEVKEKVLSVPKEVLATKGAVSHEVAEAMAVGVLKLAGADYAISVTGIAGPGGGTAEKPVGLVYVGYADKGGKVSSEKLSLFGTRERIRERSTMMALDILRRKLL
ncbi:MAG: competence/damage-inducible protein A [Candidatus Zixiibacteriota bacterium]